jgi:hypothetical protein
MEPRQSGLARRSCQLRLDLRHHDLPEAIVRFCVGLRQFAAAQGKPGLFHETITVAYLLLINERLDGRRDLAWEEFAARNADLLLWKPSILTRYYREDIGLCTSEADVRHARPARPGRRRRREPAVERLRLRS